MCRAAVALASLALAGGCASSTEPGAETKTGRQPAERRQPEAHRLTEEDRTLLAALLAFARNPTATTWAAVPARPRVRLGLGARILAVRPARALASPRSWALDPDGLFRGGAGPFSALEPLARAETVELSAGTHPRCASPAVRRPRAVAGLRQLTAQPPRVASCAAWWAVDVYVTRRGEIGAVTLDLWEP